jgi:hypothetical protein
LKPDYLTSSSAKSAARASCDRQGDVTRAENKRPNSRLLVPHDFPFDGLIVLMNESRPACLVRDFAKRCAIEMSSEPLAAPMDWFLDEGTGQDLKNPAPN